MRKLYRALVQLVTYAIPVVIAACYGPVYRYRKGGKVLDSQTKAPISQIDLTCDQGDGSQTWSRTFEDGTFELGYDTPCVEVRAEDTGARYANKTVPFDAAAPELVIELDPLP